MDSVLIQNGVAHEIWRNTSKLSLIRKYTTEILNAVVETADVVHPGYRWNGTSFVAPITAKVQSLSEYAQTTSRDKNMLATFALILRARIGIDAWNALTTQQKISQTLAEADIWKNIREFINDKV